MEDRQSNEEIKKRYELDMAVLTLTKLIYCFTYGDNPYKAKEECKKYNIINSWLEVYDLNIYQLCNHDIDILFEIMKKIDKNKIPPQ